MPQCAAVLETMCAQWGARLALSDAYILPSRYDAEENLHLNRPLPYLELSIKGDRWYIRAPECEVQPRQSNCQKIPKGGHSICSQTVCVKGKWGDERGRPEEEKSTFHRLFVREVDSSGWAYDDDTEDLDVEITPLLDGNWSQVRIPAFEFTARVEPIDPGGESTGLHRYWADRGIPPHGVPGAPRAL